MIESKLYNYLTLSQKKFVKQKLNTVVYQKKETIYKQGTQISGIFILQSGYAKMLKEYPHQKNAIIDIVKPDDINEIPDSNHLLHQYSMVALSQCTVQVIAAQHINELLLNNAAFSRKVIEHQNIRYQQLSQRLVSILKKQMHGRIADLILYLSDKKLFSNDVFKYLTRKDIAEMIGMSTENTIRILKELNNDEIIELHGKEIKVNKPELLERLSKIG